MSPLNSRTATKLAGGGGFNSGVKGLIHTASLTEAVIAPYF